MNTGTCMVCRKVTDASPTGADDDIDLCTRCRESVVRTFKQVFRLLSYDAKIHYLSSFGIRLPKE